MRRAFSSSSVFNRFACGTSMSWLTNSFRFVPFGRDRILHSLAAIFSLPLVNARIAGTRHKSETVAPASGSFQIAIICSSLNRLRFILWSSGKARANFKTDQRQRARSVSADRISARSIHLNHNAKYSILAKIQRDAGRNNWPHRGH